MQHGGNHLAGETSPYLLQHADNPVEWYPWCAEAHDRARREDKPILLSIGYSACHWCHVMAHESFEDDAVAALMNDSFINIKVDREERPDLDHIYQLAHQMLVQRPGGWPLTMFLTPEDHTPFFGGTYFPPEPRHGLPGFRTILQRVATYYGEHRDQLSEQASAIREVFARLEGVTDEKTEPLSDAPLDAARDELSGAFDEKWGGFGKAPRFPNAPAIERLLRHWRASAGSEEPDVQALYMASLTLQRMASGGINDQLGGGFCRYSVDDYWMIPHFEKMLYDNAALLPVYAWSFQATGEELFADTASATGEWMLAEMQGKHGGFYSSLDADSEGQEGRFYVWDRAEVRGLLTGEEYGVCERRYGLDRPPNFEQHWHLHVYADFESIAKELGVAPQRVAGLLDSAGRKLARHREKRVRPGLDDKILTAWNGLAISGLAAASVSLRREDFAHAATKAVDFIREHCWHAGRLLAAWREGRARHKAYLDDYAFVGMGLLRLLEARWRSSDLSFATDIADALLNHFADDEAGGFFFTADDHESLIHRPRPFSDDATPSGNAIAAQFLDRIGHLLGETRYLEAAERALAAAFPSMLRLPSAHCTCINALEDHLAPLEIVVIRGSGADLLRWRDAAQGLFSPSRMVLAIPDDAQDLPGLLAQRRPRQETVAYYCTGMTCAAPITSFQAFAGALGLDRGTAH